MTIDRRSAIKQAAENHETIGTIGTSATVGTGFVQIVMELLHRYSGLKLRMIGERFGSLDEGLVSRERRAIRENRD
jgi:hypothetical protein